MNPVNFNLICTPEEKSKVSNDILRSLPQWFGIESAILDYVNDVKSMDTWIAEINGDAIGFISINKHNPHTAEIHVMGIKEPYHQKQIGSQLVKLAEDCLSKEGFSFLSVKTLSESREDENYAKTRKFYLKNGFLPVEEFKTLWGEDNPCLFLVKAIVPRQNFKKISAVLVHVPDWREGLSWYMKAFPEARLVKIPEFDFEYLNLNGINVEIVKADEKVGSGTNGTVVYWEVDSFDSTKFHLKSIGATLYRGPMNIENGLRMCQLKDPFGNLLGLRGP